MFIGAERPDVLWDAARPAWQVAPNGASPTGRYGEVLAQDDLYGLLQAVDRFSLVLLEEGFAERARSSLGGHALLAAHAERIVPAALAEIEAAVAGGALPLISDGELVGSVRGDHDQDDTLTPHVLLENLACKATATLALQQLLAMTGIDPARIEYAIGCGEEAIGDRYQRGGGGLAKAICEEVGAVNAGGSDTKAFCCAPVHSLVIGAALIEAGVYDTVVVLAGGALGKLGMKAEQALDKGVPILEDILAGMAVLLERERDGSARGRARPPRLRRSLPRQRRLVAAGAVRATVPRSARGGRNGAARRRSLRGRAARPRDHGAGGRRRRRAPQLPHARQPRRDPRPGRARRAGRLRARARPARATRRPRGTSPPRCRGCRTRSTTWRRARSARRCWWPRAACSSAA